MSTNDEWTVSRVAREAQELEAGHTERAAPATPVTPVPTPLGAATPSPTRTPGKYTPLPTLERPAGVLRGGRASPHGGKVSPHQMVWGGGKVDKRAKPFVCGVVEESESSFYSKR